MELSMKLSYFFRVTAFSITTIVAGCASSGSDQENKLLNNDLSVIATQTLAIQPLCCNDFAQVSYPTLTSGKKLINSTSPAMQFESGRISANRSVFNHRLGKLFSRYRCYC
jgi:hypothetical protein